MVKKRSPVSSDVSENIDYLSLISRCPKHERDFILSRASPQLIKAIAECILNGLQGEAELKIQPQKKKVLARLFHKIQAKKIGIINKRKAVKQVGGILPAVLIPILTSLLGSALGKAIG